MEKRVKIFHEDNCAVLERRVNHFLEHTPGKCVDVKYESTISEDNWSPSACVIYIPEVECEKEEDKTSKKNEKGNARVQGKIVAFRKQIGPDCKV
jgi:hypothetical protein